MKVWQSPKMCRHGHVTDMFPQARREVLHTSLGLSITLIAGPDGEEIQVEPAQVISPDLPGRKVGIMGCAADTLPAAIHLDAADILVHPATLAAVSFGGCIAGISSVQALQACLEGHSRSWA